MGGHWAPICIAFNARMRHFRRRRRRHAVPCWGPLGKWRYPSAINDLRWRGASEQNAMIKGGAAGKFDGAAAVAILAIARSRRRRAREDSTVQQGSAGGAAGIMPAAGPAVLELTDIGKSFPGVQALKGVRFDMRAGEV